MRSFAVAQSADPPVQEALLTAARHVAKTNWDEHIRGIATAHATANADAHDDAEEPTTAPAIADEADAAVEAPLPLGDH